MLCWLLLRLRANDVTGQDSASGFRKLIRRRLTTAGPPASTEVIASGAASSAPESERSLPKLLLLENGGRVGDGEQDDEGEPRPVAAAAELVRGSEDT